MFRSNQDMKRLTPIQLDTALISPGNGARQNKSGYQLMIEVHTLIGLMDSLKWNLLLIK